MQGLSASNGCEASMTRIALVVLAASSLMFAQNPSPSGGWRRAGDPTTQPPPAPPAPAPAAPGGNPEPVDRSDAYGQQVPQYAPPPGTAPMGEPMDQRPAAPA